MVDGVNDHGAAEYIRLFKQAVIDERVPLLEKAKSVAVDAVQKVGSKQRVNGNRPKGWDALWFYL